MIFTLCFLLRFLMTALHLLVALIERPWSICREDKLVSVASSCLPVAFRMQRQDGSASTLCAKIQIQQQKNNTRQLRKCNRSHTLYTLTHTHTHTETCHRYLHFAALTFITVISKLISCTTLSEIDNYQKKPTKKQKKNRLRAHKWWKPVKRNVFSIWCQTP